MFFFKRKLINDSINKVYSELENSSYNSDLFLKKWAYYFIYNWSCSWGSPIIKLQGGNKLFGPIQNLDPAV